MLFQKNLLEQIQTEYPYVITYVNHMVSQEDIYFAKEEKEATEFVKSNLINTDFSLIKKDEMYIFVTSFVDVFIEKRTKSFYDYFSENIVLIYPSIYYFGLKQINKNILKMEKEDIDKNNPYTEFEFHTFSNDHSLTKNAVRMFLECLPKLKTSSFIHRYNNCKGPFIVTNDEFKDNQQYIFNELLVLRRFESKKKILDAYRKYKLKSLTET